MVYRPGAANPVSAYEAATAHREVLGDQLDALRQRRNRITDELTNDQTRGVDRTGLESQLVGIDARIVDMDKAIAQADAQVAQAAAVPGAVSGLRDIERQRNIEREAAGPPEELFVLGGMAIVIFGLPLSIAFARRMWRRSAVAVTTLPAELMDRMARVEQGVESIAIEVERIGEGQRFMTRIFSETNPGRAIGGEPVRQPVPVRGQEAL